MSDFHVDYDYQEGVSNSCGRPVCCRSDSGQPLTDKSKSGKWGDQKCDVPVSILKSMFQYIREDIIPDFILWGGDSIPHNLETLTFESNVEIMKNVT